MVNCATCVYMANDNLERQFCMINASVPVPLDTPFEDYSLHSTAAEPPLRVEQYQALTAVEMEERIINASERQGRPLGQEGKKQEPNRRVVLVPLLNKIWYKYII